ncbi:MAG TPA: paraquat-inducible protein A [Steroidobacteraceae bacterium]
MHLLRAGAGRVADGTPDVEELIPATTIECPKCGLVQHCGVRSAAEKITCCRCLTPLSHPALKSLDATLACTTAIFLLLIPALFAPFMTTSIFDATRTSFMVQSGLPLWREGWPLLGVVVFLCIVVFPVLRYASLALVLISIRMKKKSQWLGIVFRASNALQTWAMLDVFLLGVAVAYARLHAALWVMVDVGMWCFVAAAILTLVARATLDAPRAWQLIKTDFYCGDGRAAIACPSCGYWMPQEQEGCRCARCAAIVTHRARFSISRSSAMLVAAVLLYFPANLYPIATIPIDFKPTAYTVLGGVIDLAQSNLLGLAILVFLASFTIPMLKMAGLTWCVTSTLRKSKKHLVAKTRVYRLVEEVGRWSMVDPLTIACFVPLLEFNGLVNGRAEAAATPFAGVVILTTIAVQFFDPRLMWDAATRA